MLSSCLQSREVKMKVMMKADLLETLLQDQHIIPGQITTPSYPPNLTQKTRDTTYPTTPGGNTFQPSKLPQIPKHTFCLMYHLCQNPKGTYFYASVSPENPKVTSCCLARTCCYPFILSHNPKDTLFSYSSVLHNPKVPISTLPFETLGSRVSPELNG